MEVCNNTEHSREKCLHLEMKAVKMNMEGIFVKCCRCRKVFKNPRWGYTLVDSCYGKIRRKYNG